LTMPPQSMMDHNTNVLPVDDPNPRSKMKCVLLGDGAVGKTTYGIHIISLYLCMYTLFTCVHVIFLSNDICNLTNMIHLCYIDSFHWFKYVTSCLTNSFNLSEPWSKWKKVNKCHCGYLNILLYWKSATI
jgi:hypothetical protein